MINTNIPLSPTSRQQSATNFFLQGFNCCQSVLLAFSDILKVDQETLKTIASGFGGGMGRLREVCGAFSGMVMMAGFISPAADPSIKEDRTKNYALVQQFAEKFKELNGGSIVCRELLGLAKNAAKESPVPSERTADYYKKRPCPIIIGNAAKIIAEYLANKQE
ncbi:MAG: C_GCAxxG_C_C family protein [Bacteroidales bacterium]|nr:C_GCAxxG_C_C family protein [Bacteroidales bacterium]MBR4326617.1 C_GCAxxG_C_C family protein [Bacteroidales bacterium]